MRKTVTTPAGAKFVLDAIEKLNSGDYAALHQMFNEPGLRAANPDIDTVFADIFKRELVQYDRMPFFVWALSMFTSDDYTMTETMYAVKLKLLMSTWFVVNTREGRMGLAEGQFREHFPILYNRLMVSPGTYSVPDFNAPGQIDEFYTECKKARRDIGTIRREAEFALDQLLRIDEEEAERGWWEELDEEEPSGGGGGAAPLAGAEGMAEVMYGQAIYVF